MSTAIVKRWCVQKADQFSIKDNLTQPVRCKMHHSLKACFTHPTVEPQTRLLPFKQRFIQLLTERLAGMDGVAEIVFAQHVK